MNVKTIIKQYLVYTYLGVAVLGMLFHSPTRLVGEMIPVVLVSVFRRVQNPSIPSSERIRRLHHPNDGGGVYMPVRNARRKAMTS